MLPGLVFDDGTCQIAEFSTDTVDAVQDTFFSVFEVCEDMLGPYLFTCSGIFHPEVVSDADVVLDSVVVKPFEPFVTDELTVCNQTFDAVTPEQSDEPNRSIMLIRSLKLEFPRLGRSLNRMGNDI